MKLWRQRLDRTTNWAVIVLAAILTWTFSDPPVPHYVVLIGVASLGIFLFVEARRYRGYDIWRTRVRLLQENVFAYALDDDRELPEEEWREQLSQDYLTPRMKVTLEEALAHRLRRIYLPLFLVLLAAWPLHVTSFGPGDWPASAAIGDVSGLAVTAVVAGFLVALLVVAFRPRSWKGELLEAEVDAWDRHGER